MQVRGLPSYPQHLLPYAYAFGRENVAGSSYKLPSFLGPAARGNLLTRPQSPISCLGASPKCSLIVFHRLLTISFSSKQYTVNSFDDDLSGDTTDFNVPVPEPHDEHLDLAGIDIEMEKLGNNCRRIRSKVSIRASLQTIWNILTDYERLADFIPGLAVSQLLDKRENYARLFQIGQQKLAFGLKFNAKGVVDCYEKDLESLPSGQKRDIEFKMIDGDFQLFEGKWSLVECSTGRLEQSGSVVNQDSCTTLSYVVDVKPKMWLPVRLVDGILCREIKMNLSCIREEAQKASCRSFPAL